MFWTIWQRERQNCLIYGTLRVNNRSMIFIPSTQRWSFSLSSNKSAAFELAPLAPGALCSFISFQRSPTPPAGRPAIQGGGWPPIRQGDPALLLHPLGSCTALPLLPLRCSSRVCLVMIDSVAPFGQRTKWKRSAMMEDAGTLWQVLKAAPEMMQSSSFWARSPPGHRAPCS